MPRTVAPLCHLAILGAIGCGAPELPAPRPVQPSPAPEVREPPEVVVDLVEQVEVAAPPVSLFDLAIVHQIDIEVDWRDQLAWEDDPRQYVEATLTIDGQVLPNSAVRGKGHSSLRHYWDKPALKVDLNRRFPDRRYVGVKGFTLNNSVFDCTMVREVTSYGALAQLALPTARVAYAWVRLNRVDKGLYVVVEAQDDVWLDAQFSDGSGNLYDGKFRREQVSDAPTKADFLEGQQHNLQLEEGSDPSRADVSALTAALADTGGPLEHVPAHRTDFLRTVAAEEWLGQWDGYARNRNNYRVYFPPDDGLARWIITDLDKSFRLDKGWDWLDWEGNAEERGVLADACFADATCSDEYLAALAWVDAVLDVDSLTAQVDAIAQLISEDESRDPYGAECLPDVRDKVTDWLADRSAHVAERVAP